MTNIKEKIQSILRTKDIRDKVLFSLIILIVYRILSAIPVSGIPAQALVSLFQGTQLGDVLSTISGGVLESASMVAIGLTPYINASIIFQLLGTVIPKLEELRKEGPEGRRRISMYTRITTVPLAILQSFVIYSTLRGFGLIDTLPTLQLIALSATLTAGSIVMMWFSELVSEMGVGGGSSYLIMLGILSGIPGTVRTNFITMDTFQKVFFFTLAFVLVISTIIITQAERRIPIQYSRRVREGGAMESYIPVKLTQSGVMPVIFAMSLLSFPQLIAKFLISKNYSEGVTYWATQVQNWLANTYVYESLIFVFVILFALFYLTVVFNTDELSENLQKQGAFIQGVRPGNSTSEYLRKVSFRLTIVGAIFLALVSVLPNLLIHFGFMTASVISGTGLLIVIGVILDIKRQIESMVVVRRYDKYL